MGGTSEVEASEGVPALPEPYTVGDPGRSYTEIDGSYPFATEMPPDTVCDAYDFEGWALRAASVRGLLHRYGGSARQDAYAIRYVQATDRLVVVVCDGVGGLPDSHIAAGLVANFLAQQVVDNPGLSDDGWDALFADASDLIVAACTPDVASEKLAEESIASMATTALVVVVEAVSAAGPWALSCASVGDCSLWLSEQTGAGSDGWRLLVGSTDETLTITTNRTAALPSFAGISVHRADSSIQLGDRILACSDGVGNPLGNGETEVAISLRASWTVPPTALNFAAQVSFGSRSFVDDRTGVVLWAPHQ